MNLQHGVPGAGGKNAGDPAPGRSPGPPLMLNTPTNFQRLTVPSDSTRTIVRHRPVATWAPKLNDSLPEKYEQGVTVDIKRVPLVNQVLVIIVKTSRKNMQDQLWAKVNIDLHF